MSLGCGTFGRGALGRCVLCCGTFGGCAFSGSPLPGGLLLGRQVQRFEAGGLDGPLGGETLGFGVFGGQPFGLQALGGDAFGFGGIGRRLLDGQALGFSALCGQALFMCLGGEPLGLGPLLGCRTLFGGMSLGFGTFGRESDFLGVPGLEALGLQAFSLGPGDAFLVRQALAGQRVGVVVQRRGSAASSLRRRGQPGRPARSHNRRTAPRAHSR
jgi:hypothetical protein